MKKGQLWMLNILIVIAACALVWVLGYPQYQESVRISKRYQVNVNMYTLRAAVENYAAYNEGKFPTQLEDFESFFTYPINPYTNKTLNKANIQIFQYDVRGEAKERSPGSKNGRLRGAPGGLAYGYFIALGEEYPTAYGIVGFDEDGKPLAEKLPSGEVELFLLND